MASLHSVRSTPDVQKKTASVLDNVMAFPNQRAYLSVSIQCSTKDHGQAQLHALFHSTLGVYVADSRIEKGEIKVRFDIALTDLDFTMHTLIRDLPEATLGKLEVKSFPQAQQERRTGSLLQLV